MPVVYIPALLRKLTNGQEIITVSGNTLGEIIDDLDARCPGIRANLVEDVQVRPGLAVAIDGEVVDGWLSVRVAETSEIIFIQPQSGG